MRVLVTGGAGFIGSHVVDALKSADQDQDHQVLVIDNLSTGKRQNLHPGVRLEVLDLNDPQVEEVIEEYKPEAILHLAAQIDVRRSLEDPAYDALINIVGSIRLIEAAVKAKTRRFIYSSSAAVYGDPQSLPVTEEASLSPLSPYGISKHTVEHYLHAAGANRGLSWVALRYGNVYGPRQDPLGEAGVISIFTDQLLRGEKTRIYGDGMQTRDFIYVKDVARANLAALHRGQGIYNIATGNAISVRDLQALLAKTVGINSLPEHLPGRVGEIQEMVMANERARNDLAWEPQVGLEQGLAETVAALRG